MDHKKTELDDQGYFCGDMVKYGKNTELDETCSGTRDIFAVCNV